MLEVFKKRQKISCHWKFFTNIKDQKGGESDETNIFKEKLDHHDYLHICLKGVK